MKGYYPSTRQNEHSLNPNKLSGITLAEVVIAITIIVLVAASTMAGILSIQRSAVNSAYYTGGLRILQSHAERAMSIPLETLTNQTIVNYNYSGLRITSLSSETNQAAITNASSKPFVVYSNASGTYVPYTTSATEDAVLAYTTIIEVNDAYMTTNSYNSVTFTKPVKRAQITTLWQNNRGETISNIAVVIRSNK